VNKSNNSSKDDQYHLNIIVKNLPYDKREENDNSILFSKVAGLMTDGLKLTNIGIKNVIRKMRTRITIDIHKYVFNLIKIRSLTHLPLLICRCIVNLGKPHHGSHESDLMS
jgi:hypothetical protein